MTGDAPTPSRVTEAWRKLSEEATASEKAAWDADLDRLRDVLAADIPVELDPAEPADPPPG